MKFRRHNTLKSIILIIALVILNFGGKTELSSEEARKELARLNISYNDKSFYDVLWNNDKLAIDLFLKAGMNPNTIFSQNDWATPLIVAAMRNNIDLVKQLLNYGADVNFKFTTKSRNYCNALYYSITSLNVEITDSLLNKGVNTIFITGNKYITASDLIDELMSEKYYITYPESLRTKMDSIAFDNAVKISKLLDRPILNNIDSKKAMKFIFQNYDEKMNESIWTRVDVSNYDDFGKNKVGRVTKVLTYNYQENGNDKYLLITQAIPVEESYPCLKCIPLISGFIFVKKDNKWIIDMQNSSLGFYGRHGEAPHAKTVKIGPNKIGVVLDSTEIHGPTTMSWAVIIGPAGYKFLELISFDLGSNNKSDYHKGDKEYYSYKAKYEFVPGDNKEYYNIKLTTEGTMQKDGKIIPVNTVEIYVFNKNKYTKK